MELLDQISKYIKLDALTEDFFRNETQTKTYAKGELLQDKELLIAGLKITGQILYYADINMRDDEDVVLEAVRNKPVIIKYASLRLRKN